jgi:hypothetical protein
MRCESYISSYSDKSRILGIVFLNNLNLCVLQASEVPFNSILIILPLRISSKYAFISFSYYSFGKNNKSVLLPFATTTSFPVKLGPGRLSE